MVFYQVFLLSFTVYRNALYTDKKEKKFFLIYKEIQNGAVIYEEELPNI